MRVAIITICLIVSCAPCIASDIEYQTGNGLQSLSQSYKLGVLENKITPQLNLFHAGVFSGYVNATADLMIMNNLVGRSIDSATPKQLGAIVIKYLETHPEQWNKPSVSIVMAALQEAFPPN